MEAYNSLEEIILSLSKNNLGVYKYLENVFTQRVSPGPSPAAIAQIMFDVMMFLGLILLNLWLQSSLLII